MSNIENLKAQARSLSDAVLAGDATEEQVAELRAVTAKIEAVNAAAAVAARAVVAADAGTVVEDEAKPASAGAMFVRGIQKNERARVEVPFETRATVTGDLVINPTLNTVAAPAFQAPLTSLVSTSVVSTGVVSIVKENVTYTEGFTAEGAVKPAVEISYSSSDVALETVAGLTKATRQALADANYLESRINTALTSNLVRNVEAHVAGVIAAETGIATSAGASLPAAIRVAAADVEAAGYAAQAVVLNPADAAAIDLAVLAGTVVGPVVNNTIWGLRIVKSNSVAEGTAIVGDFASAITLYTRGAAEMFMTDADGTDFQKNIVTFLAEARIKAAVVAPAALRKAIVD